MAKDREFPSLILDGEKEKKKGKETAGDAIKFARRFDRYTRLAEGDIEAAADALEEGETVLYLGITNMMVTGSDKKTSSYSATSVVLTDRRFFYLCAPFDDGPRYLDIERIYESVPLSRISYCDIEDLGSSKLGGKAYLKMRASGKVYRVEMLQNYLSKSKNIADRERILAVFVKALEAAHGENEAADKEGSQKGFAAKAE